MNQELTAPASTVSSYYVAPSENELFNITIVPLSYGYQVSIGCKTLAISSRDVLKAKLIEYLDDPKATQEKFLAGTLFT